MDWIINNINNKIMTELTNSTQSYSYSDWSYTGTSESKMEEIIDILKDISDQIKNNKEPQPYEERWKKWYEINKPITISQDKFGYKCCENCSNNPRNNPNASGMCNCILPYMEQPLIMF